MKLTYQLTRLDPGNRQPVLNGFVEVKDAFATKSAYISMSFWPGMPAGNYHFRGEATLSFNNGLLKDEKCDFRGSITKAHNMTSYYGSVDYYNLEPSPPVVGLYFWFLGQIKFPPGTIPQFHPADLPVQRQHELIQPTTQQAQHQDSLKDRAQMLVTTAATLVIAQESWH